jgi:hypothetical protein
MDSTIDWRKTEEELFRVFREVVLPATEIEWYEKRLGIPAGYLIEVWDNNDWAFVIKLHALVEASLKKTLPASIGDGSLKSNEVGRLRLVGDGLTQVKLARVHGLISARDAEFIHRLAKIRNRFAHDLAGLEDGLRQHLDGLPEQDRRKLVDACHWTSVGGVGSDQDTGCLDRAPKLLFWITGSKLIVKLMSRDGRNEFQTRLRNIAVDSPAAKALAALLSDRQDSGDAD